MRVQIRYASMHCGKCQRETDNTVVGKRSQGLPAGLGGHNEGRYGHKVRVGAGPDGALNFKTSAEFGKTMTVADGNRAGTIGLHSPPSFSGSVHSKEAC